MSTRSRDECAELRERLEAETAELARLSRQVLTIRSITDTAMRTLDLREMLDSVLRRIVESMAATGASVMLLADDDQLVTTASFGLEEEVRRGFSLRVGEGFAGAIASERKALYSPEVSEDVRVLSPVLVERGIRSLLGVPLVRGDELIGVLRVGWDTPHPYDEREVQLLQLAADRFALGIVNARLYTAQQDIADALQAAMLTLPDEVPGVDFAHLYRSATRGARVGGDFFDIFELPEDRTGIVIGDVSGHGLRSAALTTVAKTTLKAYALEYDTPGRIVSRTNRVLYRESEPSVFVTAVVGILENATGRLLYANAGHPSPFICGPGGCRLRFTEPQRLLGAFEDTEYEDSETMLEPDDLLVMYTDGVIEARDRSGVFYGDERMRETLSRLHDLPLERIPAALFDDVFAFAEGSLSDDVAVLAVKRRTG